MAFLGAALLGARGGLQQVIRGVGGALQALHDTLGPVGYELFLVATVVALNVASFFLSRWIYRRREL